MKNDGTTERPDLFGGSAYHPIAGGGRRTTSEVHLGAGFKVVFDAFRFHLAFFVSPIRGSHNSSDNFNSCERHGCYASTSLTLFRTGGILHIDTVAMAPHQEPVLSTAKVNLNLRHHPSEYRPLCNRCQGKCCQHLSNGSIHRDHRTANSWHPCLSAFQ